MAFFKQNDLGAFLKARRSRLDPVACGFSLDRRRTPGLRREEVAQLANISPKWYTFLEQGRGGAPSTAVLERLSRALELGRLEREHLFHLAQPRATMMTDCASRQVSTALRLLLDAMEYIPAFVKTPVWDIVAWNAAAAAALTDYGRLPAERRNLLRLLFDEPDIKATLPDWDGQARFAVAAFRLETARVGMRDDALALVNELSESSPEFRTMWREYEVEPYNGSFKQIEHPAAGLLTFEYATFGVDAQPDLGLVVLTPATSGDRERVITLVESSQGKA